MLLAAWISRGSGVSEPERLGTVLRRLVSCPRSRSFGRWIRAAISWPKSMQEAQHGQYRVVLGRCCNCSPDYSFPASHRKLGSRLSIWYAIEDEIRALVYRRRSCVSNLLVLLGFTTKWPATAHIADAQ